jgi:hypothetical protein
MSGSSLCAGRRDHAARGEHLDLGLAEPDLRQHLGRVLAGLAFCAAVPRPVFDGRSAPVVSAP